MSESPYPGEMRVWSFPVGTCAMGRSDLWEVLDDRERQRALTFRSQDDRDRFITARATLRRLLGVELGCAPQDVTFTAGARGKPALPQGALPHFNSTHSGGWILHALTWDRPVGIDVEAIHERPLEPSHLATALAASEYRRLATLAPEALPRALARLWVAKEAYAKALGEGLHLSFGELEISYENGRPHLAGAAGPGTCPWILHEFDVDPGHVACLAFPGPQAVVRMMQ